MSETPRTDAEILEETDVYGVTRKMYPLSVHAEFAQQLEKELIRATAELAAVKAALNLTTHKLITCGVAADHPDARLAHTKAYADKWDSPQAQSVRKLRAERDALRADAERYRWLRDNHETNTVAGGIVYEVTGRHWNDAIDTAMSAARAQQPGGRGE